MHDLLPADHLLLLMPTVNDLLLPVLAIRLDAAALPLPRRRALPAVVEERLARARRDGRLRDGRKPRRAVELREVEHAQATVGHLLRVRRGDNAVDGLLEVAPRDDWIGEGCEDKTWRRRNGQTYSAWRRPG